MEGALKGVRVIDLSHVLAGPTATMILADLGAEVIHIEPPRGEDARNYGPFVGEVDRDRSGYFISLNRNKKSLVLDLKQTKGKAILKELIVKGDVFVENFRPGTMEALGFGWEEVRRINPRIIYASISGFGNDALPEYAGRPVYDVIAQAYSGLMSITGPEEGPPCRVGSSIGDIVSGYQAVVGILAALYYRTLTGKGQRYDGSMVDVLFSIMENAVVRYSVGGEIAGPMGTAHPTIVPFQAFRTKDDWLIVAAGADKLWVKLCGALGRADLAGDERFRTNPLRCRNREVLLGILSAELAKKKAADWAEIFEREGVPYSRVNNVRQIYEDPQIQYRNMLVEIEQKGIGRMKIAGSPLRLSETPGRVCRGAPVLGEHSEEILGSLLKKTRAEIESLKAEGIINK